MLDVTKVTSRQDLVQLLGRAKGDEICDDIEKVFFFNQLPNEDGRVLVVTTTGDVYSIVSVGGHHEAPAVNDAESRKPCIVRSRKLSKICGQGGVKEIVYRRDSKNLDQMYALIVTGNGQLFAWMDKRRDSARKASIPVIISLPQQRKAEKIACGDRFSVLLTEDGKVWESVMYNDESSSDEDPDESPFTAGVQFRRDMNLSDKGVVGIVCGKGFAVALTDKGELWSWGTNAKGELGWGARNAHKTSADVGPSSRGGFRGGFRGALCGRFSSPLVRTAITPVTRESTPGKVKMPVGEVVKSVVCGSHHVLASTADGRLYAWGSNNAGQLGNGASDQGCSKTPTAVSLRNATPFSMDEQLVCNLQRCDRSCGTSLVPCSNHFVTEIAAYRGSDVSAVKTKTGKVYVWGGCYGEGNRVVAPLIMDCSDLDMVFLRLSGASMSFRLISTRSPSGEKRRSIRSCLKESFNDTATADIKFVVDGKVIHVHKSFLEMRGEHFQRMFAKRPRGSWAEANADTIKIKNFSFPVYHAYLYYLYTETLVLEDFSPEDLVGLLDLAQSYFESELRGLCVEWIAKALTFESEIIFYKGATHCAAEDVQDICCDFIVRNLTKIASSGALQDLGEELLNKFIVKAAGKNAFRF